MYEIASHIPATSNLFLFQGSTFNDHIQYDQTAARAVERGGGSTALTAATPSGASHIILQMHKNLLLKTSWANYGNIKLF